MSEQHSSAKGLPTGPSSVEPSPAGPAPVEPSSVDPIVPLTMVDAGQDAIVARLTGGRGLLLRLAEMGIRPGVRFHVLSRGRPGPFIILVRDARLVIGRGMVSRMFVRIV